MRSGASAPACASPGPAATRGSIAAAERDPCFARARSGSLARDSRRSRERRLVSGGRSVNTIAGEAELAVEARALDEAALDRLRRRRRASTSSRSRWTSRRRGAPAGRLDRDSPLLGAVLACGGARPSRRSGGIDRRERSTGAGIPALTIGCLERGGHAHARRAHRHGFPRAWRLPSSLASWREAHAA